MEYAKLLQQSAGKFDYRESPLKTQMKVNELRKTIDKDGRANIIRQEPYANRISAYLSKEELNRKMNEGAMAYKRGVQSAYDDYQLEKLKNDPLKYVEKARKQTELMKLFNNPSQMEYLRKTDPIGLFYLEQAQDEEKQKDLLEQQQKREQQQQEARENAAAAEAQRVQIAREQEEARQEGIRQAVVGPPLGELQQYFKDFKGPRDVKVNAQGNLTINGRNVAVPIALAQLQKYAPELTDSMGAKEIAIRYRDSQIRQASERAGISLPQFKAELNRRKDAERMQRFLETKEQEQEPMDIGVLFDKEEPIVQQHAQELMEENPALEQPEAFKQAQANVIEARPVAEELRRQEIPATWEAERDGSQPLLRMEMLPSSTVLDNISTKDTLVKLATRFKVPYNDNDSIDVIRKKLKRFRKFQKGVSKKFGAIRTGVPEFTPLPEDDEEEQQSFRQPSAAAAPAPSPAPSPAPAKRAPGVFAYGMTEKQLDTEAKKRGVSRNVLMQQLFSEQSEREQKIARENPTPESMEQLEKLKEMGYDSEEYTDDPNEDTFGKSTRNASRRTLRRVLKATFGEDFVEKYVKGKPGAAPVPLPSLSDRKGWQKLGRDKGVKGINGRMGHIKVKELAEQQNKELGEGFTPKGSGFRPKGGAVVPLSSYPPHIIAGALHFVKQRKKLSTNQNEYNREQAKNLLNQVLKK